MPYRLTPDELAERIVDAIDALGETTREQRIVVAKTEVTKIFNMAADTIRYSLARVRVCDD